MELFIYGDPAAKTVLVQPVDEADLALIEDEVDAIAARSKKPFCLHAFSVDSWNGDLSPWRVPFVFGSEPFLGGAADTLAELLPHCSDPTKTYLIGGYSLAALFALWSAYQTDVFRGVAAASPSVWYPNFVEYMTARPILADAVYLSLGDKEENARNAVLSTVGNRIRDAHAQLLSQGVSCTLEWNEGNHFRDSDLRTAKAFAWLLDKI